MPRTAEQWIEEMNRRGISWKALYDQGKIRVHNSPRFTPDLAADLKRNKELILALSAPGFLGRMRREIATRNDAMNAAVQNGLQRLGQEGTAGKVAAAVGDFMYPTSAVGKGLMALPAALALAPEMGGLAMAGMGAGAGAALAKLTGEESGLAGAAEGVLSTAPVDLATGAASGLKVGYRRLMGLPAKEFRNKAVGDTVADIISLPGVSDKIKAGYNWVLALRNSDASATAWKRTWQDRDAIERGVVQQAIQRSNAVKRQFKQKWAQQWARMRVANDPARRYAFSKAMVEDWNNNFLPQVQNLLNAKNELRRMIHAARTYANTGWSRLGREKEGDAADMARKLYRENSGNIISSLRPFGYDKAWQAINDNASKFLALRDIAEDPKALMAGSKYLNAQHLQDKLLGNLNPGERRRLQSRLKDSWDAFVNAIRLNAPETLPEGQMVGTDVPGIMERARIHAYQHGGGLRGFISVPLEAAHGLGRQIGEAPKESIKMLKPRRRVPALILNRAAVEQGKRGFEEGE